MSRPFKLFRLQQIDSRLDAIHNRLTEIELLLGEDAAVRAAIAEFEACEQTHRAMRSELKRIEDEGRRQRIKIEQSEASLYGGKIRNPKELKDLENEVAALKRYQGVIEDRQLEAMLAEEEADEQQRIAAARRDAVQQDFDRRTAELRGERDQIITDRARLEGERSAAVEAVQAEDLDLYERIRSARRGVAVAKITDRGCAACGSTLNSALLNAAHSPNNLNRCDTCGRILYAGG